MMVLFLAFAFIGCPAEPDPVPPVTPEPEPEPPVNNFKGNVFVGEFSEGSYSEIWGYIEFLDDTNGKIGMADYDEGEPIIIDQPFTYSVTDDKATITATMEGEEFTVTTGKLTNGSFTLSIDGEETVCTKGDKSLFDVYTVCYGEETLDKDFFCELEYYAEVLDVEDDYNLDTANKKIVLTANGHKKCCEPWTILQGEDRYEDEDYIESMEMFNMLGLNKPTDYTIDIETLTITVTESGMGKIEAAMWTVLDPDGNTVTTFLPLEEAELEYILLNYYERFGLENGDYIRDDAEKTITLTASGWTKVQAAMGGGSGGDDSSEEWTVQYPEGAIVKTFASFEEAEAFASDIDLVVTDDYTVNSENQTIILTVSGWEKVQAAMAGGSDDETWTVLDPEGIPFTTFESYEEVQEYLEENELELGVDYTMDEETHTIRHLPKD